MAWSTPRTWVASEYVTAALLNTHVRDQLNAIVPVGTLILRVAAYTTTETAVEGRWLQCNGAAVSRTTYSTLFTYFNSMSPALPFGSGDGSTTFTLPDLRGRAAIAEGENADVDAMGDSDGLAIGVRKVKHYHDQQSGGASLGGDVNAFSAADYVITDTFPTSPATSLADRANHPKDGPSYQVVGSWFIKYTS